MLTGKSVRLRTFQPSDRAAFDRLEADTTARQLLQDDLPFPPTAGDSDKFLSIFSAEGPNFLFAVETLKSGTFIGTVGAFGTNWKNRRAGQYHDLIQMSLLRRDWLAAQGQPE